MLSSIAKLLLRKMVIISRGLVIFSKHSSFITQPLQSPDLSLSIKTIGRGGPAGIVHPGPGPPHHAALNILSVFKTLRVAELGSWAELGLLIICMQQPTNGRMGQQAEAGE